MFPVASFPVSDRDGDWQASWFRRAEDECGSANRTSNWEQQGEYRAETPANAAELQRRRSKAGLGPPRASPRAEAGEGPPSAERKTLPAEAKRGWGPARSARVSRAEAGGEPRSAAAGPGGLLQTPWKLSAPRQSSRRGAPENRNRCRPGTHHRRCSRDRRFRCPRRTRSCRKRCRRCRSRGNRRCACHS